MENHGVTLGRPTSKILAQGSGGVFGMALREGRAVLLIDRSVAFRVNRAYSPEEARKGVERAHGYPLSAETGV